MKTLILNGSPHTNGDTAQLLAQCTAVLEGEVRIIQAYTANIAPCVDCRACRQQIGCIVEDDMQEIYKELESCDNVILATPVYFSQPTGKLLDVCSRLQMLFCARFFLHKRLLQKPKRGGMIVVGGGNGSVTPACQTLSVLLREMGCTEQFPPVISHNTDTLPAIKDALACEKARALGAYCNRLI